MCLGEVLGRITNPGGSKKSPPQTPDPVGKESAVSDKPVTDSKKKDKPDRSTRPVTTQQPSTGSTSDLSDSGVQY